MRFVDRNDESTKAPCDTRTAGTSKDLGIHADTINAVCAAFAQSVRQHGPRPRWRGRKSLGWIPFGHAHRLTISGGDVILLKRRYPIWKHRTIEGTPKAACFAQDARGRWYVSFKCEIAEDRPTGAGEVGIDLGLKALATCSDGLVIPAMRHYRKYETALAKAQRARKKRRVKAIHAKIVNARKHHLHEWSARIARENRLIVVGNVNAYAMGRTRLAKSSKDAAWSMFRHQLHYKASRHGARYVEADERWTSQTCSDCGSIGGPKGRKGLSVRHWVCSDCGSSHDRDLNAALNILRVGRERPPLVTGIAA